MPRMIKKSLAAPLLLLSIAGSAAAGGDLAPKSERHERLPSCDIRVDYQDGSVVLEGLVFVPRPVSGLYDMRVSQTGKAGHANIRQSGEFEATPDAPGSLGVISLSRRSGGYVAQLNVRWDGGVVDCTRQIHNRTVL
ncbi:MAG: curli-like amyloid fiber formation chaperone CsgH [Methyloceanibacter sp.]|uniref:curli-like amyloid fiber formation chaperone CsgH n=1 Tax=Methyloceanibacter sp. TaxID=1965321 RepID=UPI003D9B8B0E